VVGTTRPVTKVVQSKDEKKNAERKKLGNTTTSQNVWDQRTSGGDQWGGTSGSGRGGKGKNLRTVAAASELLHDGWGEKKNEKRIGGNQLKRAGWLYSSKTLKKDGLTGIGLGGGAQEKKSSPDITLKV